MTAKLLLRHAHEVAVATLVTRLDQSDAFEIHYSITMHAGHAPRHRHFAFAIIRPGSFKVLDEPHVVDYAAVSNRQQRLRHTTGKLVEIDPQPGGDAAPAFAQIAPQVDQVTFHPGT